MLHAASSPSPITRISMKSWHSCPHTTRPTFQIGFRIGSEVQIQAYWVLTLSSMLDGTWKDAKELKQVNMIALPSTDVVLRQLCCSAIFGTRFLRIHTSSTPAPFLAWYRGYLYQSEFPPASWGASTGGWGKDKEIPLTQRI